MPQTVPTEITQRLARYDQSHLLNYWDDLDSTQRQILIDELQSVDFETVCRLRDNHRSGAEQAESPQSRARRAQPLQNVVRLPKTAAEQTDPSAAVKQGRQELESGRVGAILVAGGQGSRLGFAHPKGMFPIGPLTGASLFQILAEQLLVRGRMAGNAIPWYIMTSDATHEATVAYFQAYDHFGLSSSDIFFFRQGNMPAVDRDSGRLLMSDKHRLCLSPDGHGGMLAALADANLLVDMQQRGIEHLFYHQVDNPTAILCDPAFIGCHVLQQSDLSTKVAAKRSATENMGVLAEVDGRTEIIEYSHMPDDVARQTDDSGQLRFWTGNTAMHVFRRTFLDELIADDSSLPFHVAEKAVPHLDEHGNLVRPNQPNALKFERFIFDALPRAQRALVVKVDRHREFNPVKNREGDDSPATARAAMSALFRRWLRRSGVAVADGAVVEISPLSSIYSFE